tara:strand:- start:56 stop:442 length:387 start_codon:yes stop_codon:yes gene_type:complete
MTKYLMVLVIFFFANGNLSSVEPDEILNNEILENKARKIGKKLRCMVCQNEDIENSNADMARDLRILIRNRLEKGESENEIITYIHSRYGDYVLFSPPLGFNTIWLWLIPILFTFLLTLIFFRKRNRR